MKKLRYAAEAAAVYLIYGFFSLLPLRVASDIGGAVLGCIGPRMGVSKRAERNIAAAFPGIDDSAMRGIVLEMWDNLGRVIAEYPHLSAIRKDMEIVGRENVPGTGPAIYFGAHIANWETAAVSVSESGMRLALVYRKPNNYMIEDLLRHARDDMGSLHIAKGAAGARGILSVLGKGGGVGMLLDQKQNDGIAVPFFGRPAMTSPGAALFALRTGARLHPVRVERVKGSHLRATIFPALDLAPSGDREADTLRVMTEVNRIIEGWVRERPGQWLWLHRRWPD